MSISNSASGFRYCPSCKTQKQLTEYTIRKNGKVVAYCKPCNAEKTSKYRANNRERYLQLKKESRIKREAKTSNKFIAHEWDNLSIDEKEKYQCGIYCITINEKFYIGSCVNFSKRMKDHTRKLKYGTHVNTKMQAVFNKYQMFECEIIEFCEPTELIEIEQKHIDLWFDDPRCLNLRKDATSVFGIKRSEETKQLLSVKAKERYALRKSNGNQ